MIAEALAMPADTPWAVYAVVCLAGPVLTFVAHVLTKRKQNENLKDLGEENKELRDRLCRTEERIEKAERAEESCQLELARRDRQVADLWADFRELKKGHTRRDSRDEE